MDSSASPRQRRCNVSRILPIGKIGDSCKILMENKCDIRKNCQWCTLIYCEKNLREDSVYPCFIKIIANTRSIWCADCVISKNKGPLKKFEEMIHFFQIVEGNTPCFELKKFFYTKCG